MDPTELTGQLNDIFYKTKSPIELFHVSRLEGKLVISFTMNQETFVSTMNPKNKLIYTSSDNQYTYKEFINAIYNGLSAVFEEKDISPLKSDALQSKHKPTRFDKQLNLPFYRSQYLFEIKVVYVRCINAIQAEHSFVEYPSMATRQFKNKYGPHCNSSKYTKSKTYYNTPRLILQLCPSTSCSTTD